jgi:hypothetical protein
LVSVPTLAQVTTAGNTTTNAITVGGLTTTGQVLFNAYGAYNTGTPTLRIENVDTNNVAIQVKGNIANYKYYWIYDSTTSEGIYKTDQARIDLYGGTGVGFGFVNNYGRLFTIGGTTGNVLINTTTDAGYKLDVNGTARVQGAFTATLANVSTANVVYYNSSTGLMTYATAPIGAQFVIDYDYNIVGLKNGINLVFTTSATFIVNTTRVFLNGQRLTRGVGYDYIETGTNQITFTNPPNPTDLIIIEYQI